MKILRKYGKQGVEALAAATPEDTGISSNSWSYSIHRSRDVIKLEWLNENENENIPIVILIQYGHGTVGGTFVQGIDFINKPMKKVFNELTENLWKELIK